MITLRNLNSKDNNLFDKLIYDEGLNYKDFLKMGWSVNQINKQLTKGANCSFGAFNNNSLTSFILGDLFDIEGILEYEILLIYVCRNLRQKGLGKTLIKEIKKKNNSLKKIYLEVSSKNLEGISFYKKMNFKKIYIRKNYFLFQNKRVDGFAMSKYF